MPQRVLVVDDDPHVLKLLRVNLELEGYDVVAASSGEEALKLVASKKPDAMVCDVMMPGMTGLEVVRHIRADKKHSKLPIVIVSAKAQQSDLSEGDEAGADAYVTKPFDPQDLIDAVGRLLKRQ